MPEPDPVLRPGAPEIAADSLPATLRWAVWLLTAQAAGLGAVLGFLLYEDLTAQTTTPHGAVMITSFVALMGVLVAVLAWALRGRRGWARGPAIVLQLLLVPIGYTMVTGGVAWVGVPVIAIGLAGAGSLLAFPTRAALGLHDMRRF